MESQEGGGKMKNKRVAERKPYNRQSLFTKVTDTVKDMLSPSWLVDMVSSVKKKPTNPPAQQEPPATITQPPDNYVNQTQLPNSAQTMAYPIPYSVPIEGNSNQRAPPPGPPGMSGQFMPAELLFPFSKQPVMQTSTTVNPGLDMKVADDQSEHSEYSVSTSGCSSIVPHPDRREYQRDILQMNESKLQQLRQDLEVASTPSVKQTATPADLTGTSEIQERTSSNASFLWTRTGSSEKKGSTSKTRPSFNPSVFVSPPKGVSIFGDMGGQSSFYAGKTTFGGAASQQLHRRAASSPYQKGTPTLKQVRAKPVAGQQGSVSTCSTSQRILQALEKMSTPLTDAKRIPANLSSEADSPLTFTPGRYRKSTPATKSGSYRRSVQSPFRAGPPCEQLTSPGVASITRNNAYLLQRTPTIPAESKKQTETVEADKSSKPVLGGKSGKMRHEKSYHRPGRKAQEEEEEEVEMPDLPTEFTLPVTAMPKFDFGGFTQSPRESTPKTDAGSQFAFSSPIQNLSSSPPPVDQVSEQAFKFSSPEKIDGQHKTAPSPASLLFALTPKDAVSRSPNSSGSTQSNSVLKKGSVMDVLGSKTGGFVMENAARPKVTNDINQAESGFLKPAAELKQGSVMDILRRKTGPSPSCNSDQTSHKGGFLKPATELKQGSVMDILGGRTKTVEASGGLKQTSVLDALAGKSDLKETDSSGSTDSGVESLVDKVGMDKTDRDASSNILDKFKTPAGTWECPSCMLQNQPSAEKCPACETKKPSTQQGIKPASGLAAKFKPEAGSWECPSCMLQNTKDKSTCPACQTAKPAAQATKLQHLVNKPATDLSLLAKFKAPSGSWECPACMIQNKADAVKCLACGTSKPGGVPSSQKPALPATDPDLAAKFKPQSGSWECPGCMLNNKAEQSKCPACETAKPGGDAGKLNMPAGVRDESLAEQFKAPTGSWECDTCMVNNKGMATKCIACDTPKPGARQATGFVSQGAFKFSTDKSSTKSDTSLPTSGFKFGSSTSESGPSALSGIKFGSTTTSSSDGATTGGFRFGNTASSESGKTAGIKFGTAATSGTSEGTAKGGFTFGGTGKIETTGEIKGGFKFGSGNLGSGTSTETPAGGFKFGSGTAPKAASDTAKPAFQFGVAAVTKTASEKSDIQFGASAAKSGLGETGTFKFGAGSSNSTSSDSKQTSSATGAKGILGDLTVVQPNGSDPGTQESSKEKIGFTPSSGQVGLGTGAGGFSFGDKSKVVTNNDSSTSVTNEITPQAQNSDTAKAEPAATLFKFGGSASNNSTPVAGGISFGQSSVSQGKPFGGFSTVSQDSTPLKDQTQLAPLSQGQNKTTNMFSFTANKTGTDSASKPLGGSVPQPQPASQTSGSLFTFGQSAPANTALGQPAVTVDTTNKDNKPFTFGQSAPASSSGSALLQFGSTQSSSTPAAGPGGFVFGATTIGTKSEKATTGGFNLGGKRELPSTDSPAEKRGKPGNSDTSTAATGGSLFAPAFGSDKTAASKTTSATGVPAFGALSSSAPGSFGQTTTTAGTSAFNSTPNFNFTQSTGQGQGGTSLFQFGAKQDAPAANLTGGFNFGGQQATTNQTQASAPSAPFQFQANATPSFNFGTDQSGQNVQFSASTGGTTTGVRKIRKAVRRTKR